ncbi:MAG: hypothetical protein V4760_07085 [Bdellovibrionota bacterium]
MKRSFKTPKAATALALLLCSQVLLVGCATAPSEPGDDARLAKAEKMADRFENRPLQKYTR